MTQGALIAILFFSLPAHGWGERGHHIAGYVAAQLSLLLLSPQDQERLGSHFDDRKIMMGHLNNIPDISWRQLARKDLIELNSSTHFFDTELVLGPPSEDISGYVKQIRDLEPDPDRFIALYDKKPSALSTGQKPVLQRIQDVGTAPFRVGQLYDLMVAAFNCAKKKEGQSIAKNTTANLLIEGKYKCTPDATRLEDLAAATQLGGVMGHFVADLTQPLHATVDYDSASVGQGGLHSYFETAVLHNVDENLLNDVSTLARSPDFQKKMWQNLDLSEKTRIEPVKSMFHLIADSYAQIQRLLDLDRKRALISEGSKNPFGTKQSAKDKKAVRRSPSSSQVIESFRPLIVERLSLASLVLARLWTQAWIDGGRPRTDEAHLFATPYPLDVPFILPDERFVTEKFKSEKKSSREKMKHDKKIKNRNQERVKK